MEGTVITSDGNGYGCNEDIEPKPADQFMGLLVNILSSLLGKTPHMAGVTASKKHGGSIHEA